MLWARCVARLQGDAQARARRVIRCWGGVQRACPVAVYFAVARNSVDVVCRGTCKPSLVAGKPLVPCGLSAVDRGRLEVPGTGRPDALFNGGRCAMPEQPVGEGKPGRRTGRAVGHDCICPACDVR